MTAVPSSRRRGPLPSLEEIRTPCTAVKREKQKGENDGVLEMKESEGMKPVTKRVGRVCHRECSYVEKALLELVSTVSRKVSMLLNCNPSPDVYRRNVGEFLSTYPSR
jgi:hypothetical protein